MRTFEDYLPQSEKPLEVKDEPMAPAPPAPPESRERPDQSEAARQRSRSRGKDTIANTQIDGTQLQTETSAAGSNPPPPKKLKSCGPTDPGDAIEQFEWRKWDQGGNGDCFFRAASVFSSESKMTTQPKQSDSQHDGSWLRAQCCHHLDKHASRYSELFANKTDWQAWRQAAATQTQYADGKMLQAVAEKIGQPIVVWCEDNANGTTTYTRYVIAARFSRGFACCGRGKSPICVLLKNRHYVALVPPPGAQVPESWLRETPNRIVDLEGGVKATEVNPSPRKGIDAECPTPSVYSPPRRLSPFPTPVDCPTPSVHSSGTTHPRLPDVSTPSVHTWGGHAIPSGHTQGSQDLVTVTSPPRRLRSKQAAPSWYPPPSPSPREEDTEDDEHGDTVMERIEERCWTCPHCTMELTAPSGLALSRLRSKHLATLHPGVVTPAVYQLRDVRGTVEPSESIALADRGWSCPFCPVGLPHGLPRHMQSTAITKHFQTKHARRDTSLKAVHAARAKAYRKDKDLQPAIKQGKARLSHLLSREARGAQVPLDAGGHNIVILRPDWATWPRRQKGKASRAGTLMTCTHCLRLSNSGWEAKCVGKDKTSGATEMPKLGFVETADPWAWTHYCVDPLTIANPAVRDTKDKLYHHLRQAWRAEQFHQFLQSGRHEAQEFRQHPDLWQNFAKLMHENNRAWAFSGPEARAVALGSLVTPAWLHWGSWLDP